MYDEASDARKSAVPTISSTEPIRPSEIWEVTMSSTSVFVRARSNEAE